MTHLNSSAPSSDTRSVPSLFACVNPFVNLVWECDERRLCMSFGCGTCGALPFRRLLAQFPDLVQALIAVDFSLLRLAPHWYDALDIALFELRDATGAHDAERENAGADPLSRVLDRWLERPDLPVRVLDLVLFRHARYDNPTPALAELWVQRCLDAAAQTQDEGLLETLILACPERVRAHPEAYEAAVEAARRSACLRSVIGRLSRVA